MKERLGEKIIGIGRVGLAALLLAGGATQAGEREKVPPGKKPSPPPISILSERDFLKETHKDRIDRGRQIVRSQERGGISEKETARRKTEEERAQEAQIRLTSQTLQDLNFSRFYPEDPKVQLRLIAGGVWTGKAWCSKQIEQKWPDNFGLGKTHGGLFTSEQIDVLLRNIPRDCSPLYWAIVGYGDLSDLFIIVKKKQTGEVLVLRANLIIKEKIEGSRRIGYRVPVWEFPPNEDGRVRFWDTEVSRWDTFFGGVSLGGGEEKPKEEIIIKEERIQAGSTGLGSPIEAKIFSQETGQETGRKEPIVLIVGGVHPQEHTGWGRNADGWLSLIKEEILRNSELWRGFKVVLVDINPDGKGRLTPGGVDLQRNFGGEECFPCAWREIPSFQRNICDSDGKKPMDQPEAQALLNLLRSLGLEEVVFAVFLHNSIPPFGAVDAASCGGGKWGTPLSCIISEDWAKNAGLREIRRWEEYGCEGQYPEGLGGQPPDYLSAVLGIPAADIEFSQRNPSGEEAKRAIEGLFRALRKVLGELNMMIETSHNIPEK